MATRTKSLASDILTISALFIITMIIFFLSWVLNITLAILVGLFLLIIYETIKKGGISKCSEKKKKKQ